MANRTTRAPANLTVAAAERGFRRQFQLFNALEAKGHRVPQPVLSGMFRGVRAYPKAHTAVAEELNMDVDTLLEIIDRSGEA